MRRLTSRAPTPSAARAAERAHHALASVKPRAAARTIRVAVARRDVAIPREAFDLLVAILREMADGNAVALVPVDAELTTQRAAELLRVSRPHFVRMLDEGTMPYHMVGTHRRVLARDVVAYKEDVRANAEAAMERLMELLGRK